MKRLHFILFAYLMVGFHMNSYSQVDTSMQVFKPLLGTWSGTGWVKTRSGKQVELNQTENIKYMLDGKLLVVNGLGKDKTTHERVFEAFGVMNYDTQEKKYIFNAYTLEGQHTVANVEMRDSGFDWWFKVPNGGTIKYTAKFDEATWIEDGSFSPDGDNWYPFFHMELTKD